MANFNPNLQPYEKMEKLTSFQRCVIQNFPFIEADFDAITNYQLLCKVVEYLNNVIALANTQSSNIGIMENNIESLHTAYTQLQSFVNDYFDNLDVQDEINNKLDAMAESGELGNIINLNILPTVERDINNLQLEKVGKTDTNYVGMAQLTQDVKSALTGGSTPIVGVNSVNTTNIVDKAVTRDKISINARNVYFMKGTTVKLNTNNNSLSINGVAVIGGKRYNVDDSVTLPTQLSFVWLEPNDSSGEASLSIGATSNSGVYIGSTSNSYANLVGEYTYYFNDIKQTITRTDIDVSAQPVYFAKGTDVRFDLTNTRLTITGLVVIGGKRYNISDTVQIPSTTTLTYVWVIPNDSNNSATISLGVSAVGGVYVGTTTKSYANLVGDYNYYYNDVLDTNAPTVWFAHNTTARINTVERNVTINGLIVINGKRYNVNQQTFSFPTSGNIYVWAIPQTNNTVNFITSNINQNGVYIGIISATGSLNVVDSLITYRDGVKQPLVEQMYLGYNDLIVQPQSGPESYIIVDYGKNEIRFPNSFIARYSNTVINISNQEPMPITDSYMYLSINMNTMEFELSNQPWNGLTNVGALFLNRNTNSAIGRIPFNIITGSNYYYNTNPDIIIYGDSIVAGFSGLGFENMVMGNSGIRLRNRGIGSTGYIKTVDVGTNHLTGNDTPNVGTYQIIDYADNDIKSRIINDLESGSIDTEVVCIMAGTNDFVMGYPTANILNAMSDCITAIYEAGKQPVIITPIPRGDRDIKPLIASIIETCQTLNCPCIDMGNIGLYPQIEANKTKYYADSIGLHPNNAGFNIMSIAIANGLKNYCCNIDSKHHI